MVNVLAAAAIAWPLLLGTVVWHRAAHGPALWTTFTYMAASRICHQQPERSFSTAGVQWPVCGRCSGLYLGGAAAAVALVAVRRRPPSRSGAVPVLVAAATPAAASLVAEWWSLFEVTNAMRFVTGLLLGAAVLIVIAAEIRRR